jgi:dimethylaniline monooxygenase (N-oxide forming)
MKVGVIGAGPSGLTTIKQLRDEEHEVICFEKNDNIGGIWYRHSDDDSEMKAYDDMMLTISMKLMSFSDFMVEDRVFATRPEYLQYLNAYADKFDLRRYIQLGTVVNSVEKTNAGWEVNATANGTSANIFFDAMAICSGPFQTPNLQVPYLDKFTGDVVHSSRYRNHRDYQGKRVLVLGLAESGADIVRQISDVSARCALSIRSRPFLLPRVFKGGWATDSYTFRAHHHEMWVRATDVPFRMKAIFEDNTMTRLAFLEALRQHGLQAAMSKIADVMDLEAPGMDLENISADDAIVKAISEASEAAVNSQDVPSAGRHDRESTDCMGQPLDPPKIDLFTDATKEVVDYINEWNRKSHDGDPNYSQKMILAKNVSFVPNILSGKIEVNDSGIQDIREKTVYFSDGTSEVFDTIVLCTGFTQNFSFLRGVEVPGNNVRNLFKHSIHPDEDGKLAFIGFVRPFSGGIPICAEMQARYFALLCNKKRILPADVKRLTAEEKQWEEGMTRYSSGHYDAIPSQILFLDSLAREIGCLPTCQEISDHPELMVKMWFHSFNQACYRLTGPHSMRDQAVASILAEPLPAGRLTSLFTFISTSLLPPGTWPTDYLDLTHTADGAILI